MTPNRSHLHPLGRILAVAPPALFFLASLTGCGGALTGHWKMVEVVPSKQVFNIDDADFRSDGTFTATITIEGQTNRDTGTYKFDGFKLTFQPQAGGRRSYNAMLKFGRLEVTDGKRKVVLAKGK